MATTTAVILGRSMTENLFYSSNIVIYIKLWICMCVCQGLVLCRKVPLGVSGPLNSLNKRPWEYCWLRSLSWYCGCPLGDYCGTRPSVSRAGSGKLVPRRLHTHHRHTPFQPDPILCPLLWTDGQSAQFLWKVPSDFTPSDQVSATSCPVWCE